MTDERPATSPPTRPLRAGSDGADRQAAARRRVRRRAAVTGAVGLVLAVAAVLCLRLGVQVAPSTGGLLIEEIPLTRVVGGWVALGVACATAAVLCVVDAVARARL